MAERVRRLLDYPKKSVQWLKQQPPFPIDGLNTNTLSLYKINRPVLRWTDPYPEALRRDSIRVFITGHAVDHDLHGRDPRFPDEKPRIDLARERIHEALNTIYAESTKEGKPLELVFCSATTGTDLLGLQWALDKIKEAEARGVTPDISVRSFLGYDKETFINDSVRLPDHMQEHQDMWFEIFSEIERRGLVIEPEFRGRARRKRNPRPEAGAPKGKRFKDQIKAESVKRYGVDERGNPLYKHFDEMNDMMVRYLRRGDYVLALWDGSEPFGRGGTVYAIDAAAKRIKNEGHIIFIPPQGIIDEGHLAKIEEKNGGPVELSLSRVRKIVHQVEVRRKMLPPVRS